MNITREEVIEHYKEKLGSRWKKWGLEIVNAADAAVKSTSFDETRGTLNTYLYLLLRNQVTKTFRKHEKFYSLPDNYDESDESSDMIPLMKADICKHLGTEYYYTALAFYGNGETIRAISEKNNSTVETIRWRLKKLEDYFEKWRLDNV